MPAWGKPYHFGMNNEPGIQTDWTVSTNAIQTKGLTCFGSITYIEFGKVMSWNTTNKWAFVSGQNKTQTISWDLAKDLGHIVTTRISVEPSRSKRVLGASTAPRHKSGTLPQ